jgi:PAS domain S-box-containing protein
MDNVRLFLDNLSREQLLDRLRLALDGGDLGIWDWDLRDNSVQFDRRWCEMLGLDHAATPMTLAAWSTRVHPDDMASCTADIQAHLHGQTARYENIHRMRHANGEWLYILDRGRVAERDAEGRPLRFTGTHVDVTATERARAVVERQERLLRNILEELPAGVALLDAEDVVQAASPRWARELGLAGAPVEGLSLRAQAPGLAATLAPALARARAGEPQIAEAEAFVRSDGGQGWLRWHIRPWAEVPGQLLLMVEDVSVAVEARAAAQREQEARIASLALFAGGIAHELNSPLQIILAEAELAESVAEEGGAPDLEAMRRSVEVIRQTAERAAAITRALRTLSRDARADPAGAVAAAALLDDAAALLGSRFASGGVRLLVEPPDRDLLVRGRAAELLHVLLNLLQNGYDAVREAGAANSPRGHVRLRCTAEGDEVVFWVEDGGDGVAAAHRARVFEPFFTTKPVGAGTGLGLAISQRLAARDGGQLLLVEGAPSTTFALRLPVHRVP